MNAMPKGDLKTSACFKNFPSDLIIENEILKWPSYLRLYSQSWLIVLLRAFELDFYFFN